MPLTKESDKNDVVQQLLKERFDYIHESIKSIEQILNTMQNNFVTKEELRLALKVFDERIKPLKMFVYVVMSAMGLAVIGAVIDGVLK